MDYLKVYQRFIADRRSKEAALIASGEYTERHHVVPKSLGGTNESDNIIRLTAGDHFFAHLCLAKSYGEGQWAGVFAMAHLHSSKHRKKKLAAISKRRFVQLARVNTGKANAKRLKGKPYREDSSRCEVLEIYNVDGRKEVGPAVEISAKTGLSQSSISNLKSKKSGKTYSGWYMFEEEMIRSNNAKVASGKKSATLVAGSNAKAVRCIDTGKVFPNREVAAAHVGVSSGRNITSVCMGKRERVAGYRWEYA